MKTEGKGTTDVSSEEMPPGDLIPEPGVPSEGFWEHASETPERFALLAEGLVEEAKLLVGFAKEVGQDLVGLGIGETVAHPQPLRGISPSETTELEKRTDSSETFDVEKWKAGDEGLEFLREKDLAARFREIREPESLAAYVAETIRKDEGLRQQVADICDRTRDPSMHERQLGIRQLQRNVAGRIGELIVQDTFAAYFNDVETQLPEKTGAGERVVVDIKFKEARVPIRFGQDVLVPLGGDLYVEVKAGRESYLRNQKEHIMKQVEGHPGYSVVIVSKDVNERGRSPIREAAAESGSSVWAFLPEKDLLDKVLMKYIVDMQ